MRPEVVVGRAAARAVHRRLNEHDEVDDAVPVEVVLRPVDLVVELAQRLPQPALHATDRLIAEQPVTVRIAIRIPSAGARDPGVCDFVRVERGVPVGCTLNAQQAVRHLLVEGAVGVRTPGGGAGGGGGEQHLGVLGSGAQLRSGRVLEPEEDRRDPEHARHRRPGGERRTGGCHRGVQGPKAPARQESRPQGAHRPCLAPPHAVLAEVESPNLAAHARRRYLLGTSHRGHAQPGDHGHQHQRTGRHGNPRIGSGKGRLRQSKPTPATPGRLCHVSQDDQRVVHQGA